MLKEFKDFAMKGNVVDMAVGLVIGAAFGKIVTALVDNIIMPIVGGLSGGVDFSDLSVKVSGVAVTYGAFIQAVIDFIIIAFVIFLIVKQMNKLKKEEEAAPAGPTTEELLAEIRDALKNK